MAQRSVTVCRYRTGVGNLIVVRTVVSTLSSAPGEELGGGEKGEDRRLLGEGWIWAGPEGNRKALPDDFRRCILGKRYSVSKGTEAGESAWVPATEEWG